MSFWVDSFSDLLSYNYILMTPNLYFTNCPGYPIFWMDHLDVVVYQYSRDENPNESNQIIINYEHLSLSRASF
jgi:hypothetical protein